MLRVVFSGLGGVEGWGGGVVQRDCQSGARAEQSLRRNKFPPERSRAQPHKRDQDFSLELPPLHKRQDLDPRLPLNPRPYSIWNAGEDHKGSKEEPGSSKEEGWIYEHINLFISSSIHRVVTPFQAQ